jgi:hypothetical protein
MSTQRAATVAAGFARRPAAAVVGQIRILLKRKEINKEEPRKEEGK